MPGGDVLNDAVQADTLNVENKPADNRSETPTKTSESQKCQTLDVYMWMMSLTLKQDCDESIVLSLCTENMEREME